MFQTEKEKESGNAKTLFCVCMSSNCNASFDRSTNTHTHTHLYTNTDKSNKMMKIALSLGCNSTNKSTENFFALFCRFSKRCSKNHSSQSELSAISGHTVTKSPGTLEATTPNCSASVRVNDGQSQVFATSTRLLRLQPPNLFAEFVIIFHTAHTKLKCRAYHKSFVQPSHSCFFFVTFVP